MVTAKFGDILEVDFPENGSDSAGSAVRYNGKTVQLVKSVGASVDASGETVLKIVILREQAKPLRDDPEMISELESYGFLVEQIYIDQVIR